MKTTIACILFSFLVIGTQALDINETHVYMFAFLNITTDRPELDKYQEVFISSHLTTSFRIQMYNPNPNVPPVDIRDGHTDKRSHVELIFEGEDLGGHKESLTHTTAFRVASNGTLDIQGVKATRGSTDGFTAMPLTAESKQFYVMSYTHIPEGHSAFLIASAYDDTCVTIYDVTNQGDTLVREAFMSLGEFETYQSYSDARDFTGHLINATRPISVFTGHECAEVPAGTHFCDHVYAQVPPVSEYGKDFIVGPIAGRSPEAKHYMRFVSAEKNTVVTFTGTAGTSQTSTVHNGQYVEVVSKNVAEMFTVSADKPGLLAQFNSGQHAVPNPPDADTDPFMMVITPISHWLTDYTFSTARSWGAAGLALCDNFLTVVAKTTDISNVQLDDAPLPGNPVSGLGPGGLYSVINIDLRHGNHSLDHPNPNVRFGAFLYGHALSGDPTGYGMNLGYEVLGSPIPGDQWEQLYSEPFTGPPSTCSRPLPSVAVRGPNLIIVANLTLVTPVVDPCIERYRNHINGHLNAVKDRINYLICIGAMCKGTLWEQIIDIKIVEWLGLRDGRLTGYSVEITIAHGLDEVLRAVMSCKKSIEAYVMARQNWDMPEPISGCPVLDLGPPSMGQKWNCLVTQ